MKKILLSSVLVAACAFAAAPGSYASCKACHGVKGEKAFASTPTKIPANLSKADVAKALHGYKDGTYGGPMKGVMKGQVMKLTDAQITELAEYIGK
jgi:cytochrome c